MISTKESNLGTPEPTSYSKRSELTLTSPNLKGSELTSSEAQESNLRSTISVIPQVNLESIGFSSTSRIYESELDLLR